MTPTPIRVVIVDDEPVARRTIRLLLEEESGVELVGECGNGADALEVIGREECDVVFLDVQMPSFHGFEVLDRLPKEVNPLVVFVTAHDEHALRAFEVAAVDYLLKPFDDARFRATMRRVRERVAERRLGVLGGDLHDIAEQLASLTAPSAGASTGASTWGRPGEGVESEEGGGARRLAVRVGRRIEFVDTNDVDWIEAEDYCVRIHAGGRSHVMRETLTRLEARLDPRRFVRVHRSAIVRISRVKQFIPLEHGDGMIVLMDGTRVRVSRTRRRGVHDLLGLA